MATRKRKRSKRRSRGLGATPGSGYLTVERADGKPTLGPARRGLNLTPNRLILGSVVLAAAAGAGWFIYKRFFDKPGARAAGPLAPRQITEAEAAAGGV